MVGIVVVIMLPLQLRWCVCAHREEGLGGQEIKSQESSTSLREELTMSNCCGMFMEIAF